MPNRDPDLRPAIREHAARHGFEDVGFTSLRASDHAIFLRRWLEQGRHGDMAYLERPDAVAARTDPQSRWPELRSAIVVTMSYGSGEADDVSDRSRGIIARYARGRDYHRVMKKRLLRLLDEVESIAGRELPAARAYVDTGPVLERELAQRAGLGWFGRNTMLIHPRRGSWFFIGVLLVELDLEGDTTPIRDHCGTCNACVDACPTGALLGRDADGAPVLDANRCISYLTIEHRGRIADDLRPHIGNRIFGCDICQEVCPFNIRFGRTDADPAWAARAARRYHQADAEDTADAFIPATDGPALVDLMRMTRAEWDAFTRGSAIRRAGHGGFRRNVAVALGNWLASAEEPADEAVAVLRDALADDEPIVREHAAWSLGRTTPVNPS